MPKLVVLRQSDVESVYRRSVHRAHFPSPAPVMRNGSDVLRLENRTSHDNRVPHSIPAVVFDVFVLIAGAVLNGTVISLFITRRRIRHGFNYCILNQAAVDFFFSSFLSPVFIFLGWVGATWPLPVAICIVLIPIQLMPVTVSTYATCLSTLNRMCAVLTPIQYKLYVTTRLVQIGIAGGCFCVLAIGAALTMSVSFGHQNPSNTCFLDQYKYYVAMELTMIFEVLCSITTAISYIAIAIVFTMRRRKRSVTNVDVAMDARGPATHLTVQNVDQKGQDGSDMHSKRASAPIGKNSTGSLVTVAAMALAFLCCYVPYFFSTLLNYVLDRDSVVLRTARNVIVPLFILHAVVNPLIALLTIADFRPDFRKSCYGNNV